MGRRMSPRFAAGIALLGALALSGCAAGSRPGAQAAAPAGAAPDLCDRPVDAGYTAGVAGAPAAGAERFAACGGPAEAAAAYRTGYGAGVFAARQDAMPGGSTASFGGGATGRSPEVVRRTQPRRVAPTTSETLALTRCRYAAARLTGAAGGALGSECAGLRGAQSGLAAGQTARAAQAEALSAQMERNRLRTRLLGGSASAAERRLIENRLRTLNRADAQRRIQDPLLR